MEIFIPGKEKTSSTNNKIYEIRSLKEAFFIFKKYKEFFSKTKKR